MFSSDRRSSHHARCRYGMTRAGNGCSLDFVEPARNNPLVEIRGGLSHSNLQPEQDQRMR